MDCLFNKQIPKSTSNKVILRPTSKTFISGIAPSYDTTYPEELREYISEKEYSYMINKIVDELSMMWPCCFCYTFGYLFSICTIGLSFMFPYCCISEARLSLEESLRRANQSTLLRKNLRISYRQKCSTSWLEIEVLNKEEEPLGVVGITVQNREEESKKKVSNFNNSYSQL